MARLIIVSLAIAIFCLSTTHAATCEELNHIVDQQLENLRQAAADGLWRSLGLTCLQVGEGDF